MSRSYRFVAGDDSLDAFRRLRGGWAGFHLMDGEFHVRLQAGGSVRLHVDSAEIEPGFEVSSIVADASVHEPDVAASASPFTLGGHDVLVFPGVSWMATRPDMGSDVTIQFSGPPHAAPEAPEAICETTDAVAILSASAACVIRVSLKPGHLEMVDDPAEVAALLEARGYGAG